MTMVKTLVALATERMLLKTSGPTFLKGIEFMYAAGLAPDRLSVMMTSSHKFVLQFHSKCDIRPFAANYPNFARVLRGIVHVRAWRIKSIEFVNVAFHMRDVENLERAIEKLGVELVLLRNCTYPGVSRGEEAVKFLSALNRKKQAVVCEYGDDRLKHRIARRAATNRIRRPSRMLQDVALVRLNADNEREGGDRDANVAPAAAPAPVQPAQPPAHHQPPLANGAVPIIVPQPVQPIVVQAQAAPIAGQPQNVIGQPILAYQGRDQPVLQMALQFINENPIQVNPNGAVQQQYAAPQPVRHHHIYIGQVAQPIHNVQVHFPHQQQQQHPPIQVAQPINQAPPVIVNNPPQDMAQGPILQPSPQLQQPYLFFPNVAFEQGQRYQFYQLAPQVYRQFNPQNHNDQRNPEVQEGAQPEQLQENGQNVQVNVRQEGVEENSDTEAENEEMEVDEIQHGRRRRAGAGINNGEELVAEQIQNVNDVLDDVMRNIQGQVNRSPSPQAALLN